MRPEAELRGTGMVGRYRVLGIATACGIAVVGLILPVTTPAGGSTVTPQITSPASGVRMKGPTIPVRGTGAPGTRVYVWHDQEQPGHAADVAGDGTWAVSLLDVPEGARSVYVSPMPAKNVGSGPPTLVRLDNTPPTGNVTVRTRSGTTSGTSDRAVYLVVSATEMLEGIRARNNDEPYLDRLMSAGGDRGAIWSLPDIDGPHRVSVQLADMVGWVSQDITVSVTLDRVAPRVSRTWPPADAQRVPRRTAIRARFDDQVAPKPTVALSKLAKVVRAGTRTHVKASVSYDPETRKVRIVPTRPLRRNATYKVVIGGFKDPAGNLVDQDRELAGVQRKIWRFRTR